MIGRIFGWLCLVAAGAVLVRDALAWHTLHVVAPESFKILWFDLGGNSYGRFEGAMLATMPWLWHLVVAPLLSLWAGPALLILALGLLWIGRAAQARRH